MDVTNGNQILFNVLKAIKSGNKDEYKATPSQEYLVALQTIGLIKMGWDNELTDFGENMLRKLENDLIKW